PSRSTVSQGQLPNVPVQGANMGKITNSYRTSQPGARPVWVDVALNRSLAYLGQNAAALGLANAEGELALVAAEQDDLGMTHVHLDQNWNGVPVFGGRISTHLDATDTRSISHAKFNFTTGRVFADARQVGNTSPTIPSANGIALAIADLGYKGNFARPPEARLVILPEAVKGDRDVSGAKLAWKVDLLVNDGTTATRPVYFINANNGQIDRQRFLGRPANEFRRGSSRASLDFDRCCAP